MSIRPLLASLTAAALGAAPAVAQQVSSGLSQTQVGHRFTEHFGVGFHLGSPPGDLPEGNRGGSHIAGWFLHHDLGGLPAAVGGFATGAGTQGGIALQGNGWGGQLTYALGQSSQRSLSSTSAAVTTLNGRPGMIADQVQVPLVLGVVPVVQGRAGSPPWVVSLVPPKVEPHATGSPVAAGNHRMQASGDGLAQGANRQAAGPAAKTPFARQLADARHSSAGQPALSVQEIRRQQAAAAAAVEALGGADFARGREAEAQHKFGAAKVYYRMAARRATGELKQQALERLRLLGERDR